MADAAPPRVDRNLAIDAVKGIGILQVVVHHALGQGARSFARKGDWAWEVMRGIAWATNFAIPLFLLLSAMLLAGSLRKSPQIGRFLWRRGTRSLWPYLVWTAIYLVIGVLTVRFPTGATLDVARLTDPERLRRAVLWGKAFYHLYFMVILLQLSLALPFVFLVLRRVRLNFGAILLVSAVLQALAFWVQKHVLRAEYPATLLIWYVGPLFVGAWIGLDGERWRAAFARWWPALLGVAFVAVWTFTVMNVDAEAGRPAWNGAAYNWTSVVFRLTASLLLLGTAPALAGFRIGPFLAALGRYSLPIYLVHPEILRLLGGPRATHAFALLPVPVFWTIIVVTALSVLFGWLTSLLRLDVILFGQRLPR